MRQRFCRLAVVLLGLAAAMAAPARAGWDGYRVIMWQDHGLAARAALPALGVDAAMVMSLRAEFDAAVLRRRAAPFLARGLAVYVENIATDFYAPYHRWHPDHPVDWLFAQTRARFRHAPTDPANFIRRPGLSDPLWQARIAARLAAHVQALAGDDVLFYDLGDETGIADLAAAWDFDFSADSLAGFRSWLRAQYASLGTLNRAWGTRFAAWDDVMPEATDTVLRCTEGHFAPWADFKAWMDVAFARAVRRGTRAVHAADPAALAGLEGGQVSGWGGYDYTLLAPAVDVMEIYDHAEALAVARAFHPGLVLLTTSFGDGPREVHRLWHAALLGSRGTIIWDSAATFQRADGTAGPRARTLAPLFAALHGAPGRALREATPLAGPVAVLYAPAGFRIGWLLDRQAAAEARGADWAARDSAREYGDSPWRDSLVAAAESLRHLGMPPRLLSPAMLADGALRDRAVRALLLPRAVALSDADVAAIRAFAAVGGRVLADLPPGGFDAHGTRRATLPLAGVARLIGRFTPATLAAPLARAGAVAAFPLTRPDGHAPSDVTTFLYRDGNTTLLALQRDLPAAGPLPPPETLTITLPGTRRVHDLLRATPSARGVRLALTLDAVTPTLLAIGPH